MDEQIRLIVGLGNPGADYAQTRHNVGFRFADRLAARHQGVFKSERKFGGEACVITVEGERVRLFKPMTYMNRSGNGIRSVSAYYEIRPPEILVVHDELDLPVGTTRLKRGGGDGGHNGLRDTIAHIGREFMRLRIGIGRPDHSDDVIDYVLKRSSRDDEALIDTAMDEALDVMPILLTQGEQRAMHRLHTRESTGSTD